MKSSWQTGAVEGAEKAVVQYHHGGHILGAADTAPAALDQSVQSGVEVGVFVPLPSSKPPGVEGSEGLHLYLWRV